MVNKSPSKLASADEVQDVSDAEHRSVYGNTRGRSCGGATKQFAAEGEFRTRLKAFKASASTTQEHVAFSITSKIAA